MGNIEIPATEGLQGTPIVAEPAQTQERPIQVENDGSAPEVSKDKSAEAIPSHFQDYINAQKRANGNTRKDIADLKEIVSKMAQSQAAQVQAPSAPSPQVDIFTDPQTYVRNEVRQALDAGLRQELGKERLVGQQEKAEAYILSQDYIDPESETDRAELQKIFQERGFAHTWNINPFQSAEGILEIYRARKGIGKQTPPRAQAGAVLSGASSNSNGKKTWTAREVGALSLQDYEKHRADIEAALIEGRYKE